MTNVRHGDERSSAVRPGAPPLVLPSSFDTFYDWAWGDDRAGCAAAIRCPTSSSERRRGCHTTRYRRRGVARRNQRRKILRRRLARVVLPRPLASRLVRLCQMLRTSPVATLVTSAALLAT